MTTVMLESKEKKELRPQFSQLSMKEKYQLYDIKYISYLDIECTNLNGDFGGILSWSKLRRDITDETIELTHDVIKESDITLAKKKRDVGFDKRIISSLLREIVADGDDLLVGQYFHGWNKFDIPFIRTRAFMLGIDNILPEYRQIKYGDCWKMAHMTTNMSSYRLDNIAEVLGVKVKKTRVKKKEWILAGWGEKKALEYVLDHNIKDVKIIHQVHKKLERFVSIPAGYV